MFANNLFEFLSALSAQNSLALLILQEKLLKLVRKLDCKNM